jgi:hypothetical protein
MDDILTKIPFEQESKSNLSSILGLVSDGQPPSYTQEPC